MHTSENNVTATCHKSSIASMCVSKSLLAFHGVAHSNLKEKDRLLRHSSRKRAAPDQHRSWRECSVEGETATDVAVVSIPG